MGEACPRMAWIYRALGQGMPIELAGSTGLRHRVAGAKP
ncbi:hypothetical protein ABH900_002111 [Stenotrophomonas sp. AN71]